MANVKVFEKKVKGHSQGHKLKFMEQLERPRHKEQICQI